MLSQTVEYALRAMVHLAALHHDSALNSETIAARTKVPKGYLSKLLRDLTVAELLVARRGPRGGFTLARTPARISVLEVINAVDPIKRIKKCPLGNPAHLHLCPLHRRLDDAIAMVEREFSRTTLAELTDSAGKHSPACRSFVKLSVRAAK